MSATGDATLADMTSGFRDVVHGSQRTFRILLDAVARPGLVLRLPDGATTGIVPPSSLGLGMSALLLSLLDADTTTTLCGTARSAAAEAYLRFHTGAVLTTCCERAGFVVIRGHELDPAIGERCEMGTDEVPQAGAMLFVEVDALGADAGSGDDVARLVLRGPGIERECGIFVAGPPSAFWHWRGDLHRRLPRGIDLILVCGDRLLAVPRSTRIVVSSGSR